MPVRRYRFKSGVGEKSSSLSSPSSNLINNYKRQKLIQFYINTLESIKIGIDLFFCLELISDKVKNSYISNLNKIPKYKKAFKPFDNQFDIYSYAFYGKDSVLRERTLLFLKNSLNNIKKIDLSDNEYEKRINTVCELFGLKDKEKDLLTFFYFFCTDLVIENLYDTICSFLKIKVEGYRSTVTKLISVEPTSIITNISKVDICNYLSEDSTLIKTGILNNEEKVASDIIKYIEGHNEKPIFTMYYEEFVGKTLPLGSYSLDKSYFETIENIINNKSEDRGINILLYGKAGTGKTEFSRSICSYFKRSIYEIKNKKDAYDFRMRAIYACLRVSNPNKSIIIVDEADSTLNAYSNGLTFDNSDQNKALINNLLDNSKNIIIWITNRIDGIDESTKRRFDYSLEFKNLNFSQRKMIWNSCLEKYNMTGIFSKEDIEHFASEYEISSGGIDIVIRNISSLKEKDKHFIMDFMVKLIMSHRQIMEGSLLKSSEVKSANAPVYSLDGLNIKTNINEVIIMVEKFNTYWSTSKDMTIKNMNILLYGPPGTGKTEFAKYISRHTNRGLIIKRASDILSMWVGESEKNIRKSFEDAESSGSILFIDEADSLFSTRENAHASWEITQVNEMLTNMETFKGILICATNYRKIMDCAAIRRFNMKLEFDFLKSDGNLIFYKRFLSPLLTEDLTSQDINDICSMTNLTPGDFKIVYQKFSFYDKSSLDHKKFISSLKEELVVKDEKAGKKMGFNV